MSVAQSGLKEKLVGDHRRSDRVCIFAAAKNLHFWYELRVYSLMNLSDVEMGRVYDIQKIMRRGTCLASTNYVRLCGGASLGNVASRKARQTWDFATIHVHVKLCGVG